LTASFILADLGIANRPRAEHAAYISSWLTALKSEPRAIFTAAGKAQLAADWMHAMQPVSGEAPLRAKSSVAPSADVCLGQQRHAAAEEAVGGL
jgi:antirestriction protein ArdC